MTINPSLIIGDEIDCDYYGDGRKSMGIYISADPSEERTVKKAEEYREFKFSKMKDGFLPENFAAAANICPSCNLCVPIRVNVSNFTPSKSQTLINKHADKDIDVMITRPIDSQVLYDMFHLYLEKRHPNSPMRQFDRDMFRGMIYANKVMIMAARGNDLLGFTLIDRHQNQASLEHIFFDPDFKSNKISLGKMLWLKTLSWAKEENIESLYIGPYNNSRKLSYKASFSGLEVFNGSCWEKHNPDKTYEGPDWVSKIKAEGFELQA